MLENILATEDEEIERAASEKFLPVRRVHARYDVSDPTLRRWLRNTDFPKPVLFSGRRYWRLSDLVEWEEQKAAHSGAQAQ